MNLAEKKRYLQSYYNLIKEIAELDMKISELREDIRSTKQVLNDGMPRGNRVADLSDYIARLDELEIEHRAKRLQIRKKRMEIEAAIDKMEDSVEKLLLKLRYLQRLHWENISKTIKLSIMQAHRIHTKALKNLEIPNA